MRKPISILFAAVIAATGTAASFTPAAAIPIAPAPLIDAAADGSIVLIRDGGGRGFGGGGTCDTNGGWPTYEHIGSPGSATGK